MQSYGENFARVQESEHGDYRQNCLWQKARLQSLLQEKNRAATLERKKILRK